MWTVPSILWSLEDKLLKKVQAATCWIQRNHIISNIDRFTSYSTSTALPWLSYNSWYALARTRETINQFNIWAQCILNWRFKMISEHSQVPISIYKCPDSKVYICLIILLVILNMIDRINLKIFNINSRFV